MKRIGLLDASWLSMESYDTPMHVAALMIFEIPKNSSKSYVRDLFAKLRMQTQTVAPWNYKLKTKRRLGALLSRSWVEDQNINLDFHVRHSALPSPGSERELGVLVSRLHAHQLDLNRPLWEYHLIEGLEHNRFAIYFKVHHSLVDGVNGAKMIQRTLNSGPNSDEVLAFWSQGYSSQPLGKSDLPSSTENAGLGLIEGVFKDLTTIPHAWSALVKTTKLFVSGSADLVAPFDAPHSTLNSRVTAQRRYATQSYDIDRLKRIAKVTDSSVNDIVLYLCGTSLRRFLGEVDSLPKVALTACLPVNIRSEGDDQIGTRISFIMASLATHISEAKDRLEAIKNSTQAAKNHIQDLTKESLRQYTNLLVAPELLMLGAGLTGRVKPAFNLVISNVHGPTESLYLGEARMISMFPVSMLTHGSALNITCFSYAGKISFGFLGALDALPGMQNIAVYMGDALEELELIFSSENFKRTA